MTVTPTVTPTFTPTPSVTPCTYYGIDYTFVVGKGFPNTGVPEDIQQDSKKSYYVGGIFTSYNENIVTGIVKLSEYGVYDKTFQTLNSFSATSASNRGPKSFKIQSDDKIVCVGNFTQYSGVSVGYLCRLNTDGSLDTEFTSNNGTGANLQLNDLVIQSDGKIVIVGVFSNFNGNSSNSICRLNSDGSFDSTFNFGGVGFNLFSSVDSIDILADDSMIMVGTFSNYNGTPAAKIIKLTKDGAIDTSFIYGTGFTGGGTFIGGLFISSDSSVYVRGSFNTYNGTPIVGGLLKLNSDGTIDTTFSSNLGTGWLIGNPTTIKEDNNGKIVLGSPPTSTVSGYTTNGIVRLYPSGLIDTTFSLSEGANFQVTTIHIDDSNRIVAGGQFTEFNQNVYGGLIRLFPCQE
jgi:uncharacterized delta-60 repeat protein